VGEDDKPEQSPSDSGFGEPSGNDEPVLLPPEADAVEKGLQPGDADGVELRDND
jgi:hypothetical protein